MSGAMRIGTVGWSVTAAVAERFPAAGTQLGRYAARLDAVEINSSFYRPHRVSTYRRWADSVPPRFRFAVKVPRAITHERRLVDCAGLVTRFAQEVAGLGATLGVLLVQLPPSLPFSHAPAEAVFAALAGEAGVPLACEPRHASWFTPEVDAALAAWRVARVAADPPPTDGAEHPGGWRGLTYRRLHGSPRIYHSDYDEAVLDAVAAALRADAAAGEPSWCIFDNTALGHALGNALALRGRLGRASGDAAAA